MNASSYRWVIVAAGGLLGCVAIGGMFSLPVFLQPIAKDTGGSVTGISSAMTIGFLAMACTSMAWGTLTDRFGPLPVVLTGSIVLALSLFAASHATSLIAFQFVFGLLVGSSCAAIFAPMMATVTGWFDTHRSLAVSLVSAGMGMAPLTISPLVSWLITHYGWRAAMFDIGLLGWVLLIPAAMFVRRPPANAPASATAPEAESQQITVGRALTSPQFLILGFTFFLCCASHSGPIFHVVSYAMWCGLGSMAAVSVYSVEGLAGLGGRLLFGLLADRYGAKRVLVGGLLAQAISIATYLKVNELREFYALAVIFGVAYGGGMPLYASLARDYFGQRIMGTVFGAATMLSSLGMSIGPVAGGWVFDTYNNYAWLYISSAAVAVGAVLMATTFPKPVPVRMPVLP